MSPEGRELWDAAYDLLSRLLLPTASVSLVVMFAVRLLGRERLAPLAAALALYAGMIVGNTYREIHPWQPDNTRPLSWQDVHTVTGWSLEAKPAENPEEPPAEELPRLPPRHYWLVWLAGFAVLLELLACLPKAPVSALWVARTFLALLAARLLIPERVRLPQPWLPWAFGLVILWAWAVLRELGRRWKDGTVLTGLVVCCLCAAVVLLHAHSASLMDLAFLLAAALTGPALLAWKWPGETAPAAAAVAVFLPGLLLVGQQETYSAVPWYSFWLVGLAPLALTPLVLPVLVRRERWQRWLPGLLLPVLCALIGVVSAALAAPLEP